MHFDLRQICRVSMDSFLPRGSGEEKALLLQFTARADIYLEYNDLLPEFKAQCDAAEEDDGVYESITEQFTVLRVNMLLIRPMNYTRVLVQKGSDEATRGMFNPVGNYHEQSYHDSGWDSGFNDFDRTISAQAQKMIEAKARFLNPEAAQKLRASFSYNLESLKLVSVKAERLGDEKNREFLVPLIEG